MRDMLENEAKILPEPEEEEIWVPCPGYEKTYVVSSFGRVQNIKTHHILSPSPEKNGYLRMCVYEEVPGQTRKKQKTVRIHRLICEAFHGSPTEEADICDHIDKCRVNNYYKNLRWVNSSGNRYNIKEHEKGRKRIYFNRTPIVFFNLQGEYQQRFDSIHEAHKVLDLSEAQIYANITKQRKNFANGYFMTERDYLAAQKV